MVGLNSPQERFSDPRSRVYVGLARDDAIAAARDAGVELLRVVDVGSPTAMTADYRPARLNLQVKDGIVIGAGYFWARVAARCPSSPARRRSRSGPTQAWRR
jgi:hypothetical protein